MTNTPFLFLLEAALFSLLRDYNINPHCLILEFSFLPLLMWPAIPEPMLQLVLDPVSQQEVGECGLLFFCVKLIITDEE
jgi:hypothetical protein